MILEVADISIQPGHQAAFEQAVHEGIRVAISTSKGFCKYELRRSIESPERYLLLIHWETLQDHTEGFRNSPAYGQWRGLVGPFFVKAPMVEHFEVCAALG
ncbi:MULTISPECIES: antibiotic biosynthesis monooxygenase family protein [unclassified Acidovorax]|jgi:heme-degrading monooxygenase HmoA|uniref:antibiotic biosynthesis monooxygenase family protein n=1 Tax=unclassified Acidovorax TaxID=2684926 RepID=UPI000B405CBE|nr:MULTISPECIES: antibiotic biosynthesis monooxygenase family protein [unclassified Acidovorax]MBP3981536.1 antibiotic biosynthesis monooxygenase [Acidovorax sp. JG5]